MWPAVVVVGLVLVEHALVAQLGPPARLLRASGDLGRGAWADPVTPVLSLMGFVAELLVGYVLVVMVLRLLCLLPGSMGRIARSVTLLVTPAVVRRLVDLLVGGTLLAQATLVAAPAAPVGAGARGPYVAFALCSTASGLHEQAPASSLASTGGQAPQRPWPVEVPEPVEARPTPRRSAVPVPPWLGGGPSRPPSGSTGQAPSGSTGQVLPGPLVTAPPGSLETAPPGPAGSSDAAPPGPTREAPPEATGRAETGYVVEVGDTLWDIATAHLPATERSAANVQRYWQQIYRANRSVIGADPNLIHPGTHLDVFPFRRDRP